MNDREQLQHFADELDKLVDRYREEYEISFGAIIDALQMKSYLLCQEAQSREDEL
jgi:hypothetical protein